MIETRVVNCDPEIMSGIPVFLGTRVPVVTLIDYLQAGDPLAEFLDDFPSVTQEQAVELLEQVKHWLAGKTR